MATRYGLQRWYPEFFGKFGALTVFDLMMYYLKSGRIKVDKAKITQRVAYHDPCNYGRKSEEFFGHGFFEEPRWILDQCVSDWVDLYPSKANQYCCGGGGGRIWMETVKGERFSDLRLEQARDTGAEILATSCPYCIANFEDSKLNVQGSEAIEIRDITEIIQEVI